MTLVTPSKKTHQVRSQEISFGHQRWKIEAFAKKPAIFCSGRLV